MVHTLSPTALHSPSRNKYQRRQNDHKNYMGYLWLKGVPDSSRNKVSMPKYHAAVLHLLPRLGFLERVFERRV